MKKNSTTYGHLLPDIWPRIVKAPGMLRVAEQSLSPESWTCLNIRHAEAWGRNEKTDKTRLSVSGVWGVCVPGDLWHHAVEPSKWNPKRGPSWHFAPTASGQARRFYVHRPLYGSAYIGESAVLPPDPLSGWNLNPTSLPSTQKIYTPENTVFF